MYDSRNCNDEDGRECGEKEACVKPNAKTREQKKIRKGPINATPDEAVENTTMDIAGLTEEYPESHYPYPTKRGHLHQQQQMRTSLNSEHATQ
jgi:hypothetical protein